MVNINTRHVAQGSQYGNVEVVVPVPLACSRPRLYPTAERTYSKLTKLLIEGNNLNVHISLRRVYLPIESYVALNAINHEYLNPNLTCKDS